MIAKHKSLYNKIPAQINSSDVVQLVQEGSVTSKYMAVLKAVADNADEIISGWLNINVKTFRNYKTKDTSIKQDLQEHTIMLISLMKHGQEVFGTAEDFSNWLSQKNFYLDWKKPNSFLNTISGIRFIDDQLTSIEYGDNA